MSDLSWALKIGAAKIVRLEAELAAAQERIKELEQQLAQRGEWEPVQYEDIFTPSGKWLRPELASICDAWEAFNRVPLGTRDEEYKVCRRKVETLDSTGAE